jgi:hypothetical protein
MIGHHQSRMPNMLFRRFALVTTSIALMGILLSNLIESTRPQTGHFAIQNRLDEWQAREVRKACEDRINLCASDHLFVVTI